MIGAGSSVGRITMGPIADAAGRIGTFRFALFSTGITLAMWSICFTPEEFYVFGFFYGFTSGSFIALAPAAAGELWGVNNLGGITALFNVVALPGSLASGPLAGVIYLHTGSYLGAIGMGSCCILISAVSLFGVRHSNNVNWIEDNNGKDVTTATVVRVEDLD